MAGPREDSLLAVYVTLAVAGLAGGGKLMAVGPFAASATVIAYQLSFLIIDYVNEVFGKDRARSFVRLGFVAIAVALACFIMVALVPPAAGFMDAAAYRTVFAVTPRIAGAGLVAFIVAQLENVWIYDVVRRKRPESTVMLRSALSTAIAQFVDTVVFIAVAFAGTTPQLWRLLVGQYVIKLALVAVSAPLLDLFVRAWR